MSIQNLLNMTALCRSNRLQKCHAVICWTKHLVHFAAGGIGVKSNLAW